MFYKKGKLTTKTFLIHTDRCILEFCSMIVRSYLLRREPCVNIWVSKQQNNPARLHVNAYFVLCFILVCFVEVYMFMTFVWHQVDLTKPITASDKTIFRSTPCSYRHKNRRCVVDMVWFLSLKTGNYFLWITNQTTIYKHSHGRKMLKINTFSSLLFSVSLYYIL